MLKSCLLNRAQTGRAKSPGVEFVTSVEVLPPKGCDATKTLEAIKLLKTAGVDAVNISRRTKSANQDVGTGDGDFS
jgi:hypothetical protein